MEITESQWLNRMNNPVEEKRMQAEEHKQAYDSLRFSNPEVMMTRFLPKDTISSIRPQKSNPSSSTTPWTPPISPEPPDPPDFNQSVKISVINDVQEKIKASSLSNPSSKTRRKKLAIPLRYSCDEIYERMTNGLCIFCEEQNTHDHQLKHKRYQIFVKERDDQGFDDEELVEPAVETSSVLLLPNGEDTLRSVIGFDVEEIETNSSAKVIGSSTVKDVIVTNLVQEEESSTEKQTKPEVFYLIEKFPCHQVLNSDWEQRMNNMLQSHIGMDLVVFPVKCDVDKLFVSKVLTSANGKRPLDPGITKMFNKSLVCLGAHNKKFEAELEIYMHRNSTNQKLRVMYHCAEMESSWFKKLNEMGLSMSLQKNPELVTPLVKETQDWIVNAWPKIQVCYGFALASWNGLEIYGCKYKKQMLMLVKQCYRVWECGGFLATNIYLKLLEKLYKHVSVLNARSRLFFFVSDGRISFTGLLSYCLEDLISKRLAYLVELKKVLWCGRNIGEGTTELNQYLDLCTNALVCYDKESSRDDKLDSILKADCVDPQELLSQFPSILGPKKQRKCGQFLRFKYKHNIIDKEKVFCFWEYKKQMMLLIYHGLNVKVLYGLIAMDVGAIVDELVGFVRRIVTVFPTESQFNFQGIPHHSYGTMLKQWVLQVVFMQLNQRTFFLSFCKGPVCAQEKKTLRHASADTKEGSNTFQGDGKAMLALAITKYVVGKADGSICDIAFDRLNFNDEGEFVGFTESSKRQLTREILFHLKNLLLQLVAFGCALIGGENYSTYSWLLRMRLKALGDQVHGVMVTLRRELKITENSLKKSESSYAIINSQLKKEAFTDPATPTLLAVSNVQEHESIIKRFAHRLNNTFTKIFVDWKLHPPDQAPLRLYHDSLDTFLLIILEDKDSQQGSSVTGLLVMGSIWFIIPFWFSYLSFVNRFKW